MSDLARWEVRGPVRTVRTQFAERDPATSQWRPLRTQSVATFRPDGQLSDAEHHNPDGSIGRDILIYDDAGRLTERQWWSNDVLAWRVLHTYDARGRFASAVAVDADGTTHEVERCQYDENGRMTKHEVLPALDTSVATCSTGSCGPHVTYVVEGTDVGYPAPGAASKATIYDEHERPSEVVFHDASGVLVSRIVFSRDQDGRVVSERMELSAPARFFSPSFDANRPADEQAALLALFEKVFEGNTFSRATYAYDHKGRRTEIVRWMGVLSEGRETVSYDDFDNRVKEVRSHVDRGMRMDDDGIAKTEEGSSHADHVRYEYQYDAHGNWTERIVWQRIEESAEERPSNIVRRTITY